MSTRRPCRLFHVDAFTRERFCGNPAVIVLDADELSEEQMQTIAAEINSETAFVLDAESSDHDLQIKYFTPRHPVAFVGHATIAAHYVLAKKTAMPAQRQRLRTDVGIIEIDVTEVDGDFRIGLTQNPPMLGPIIPDHHRRQVLDALGISSTSLHKDCPLQIMVKGGARLLIGLNAIELLDSLKPDFEELARLTSHVGAEGYFVFAATDSAAGQDGRIETISRMFVPAMGIPEDPVSGNVHSMLGVYLVNNGMLTPCDGRAVLYGQQGMWMRRPGAVKVEVECSGRVAQSVRIIGDAVIIYEAEVLV